jgi:hypothetical protein
MKSTSLDFLDDGFDDAMRVAAEDSPLEDADTSDERREDLDVREDTTEDCKSRSLSRIHAA